MAAPAPEKRRILFVDDEKNILDGLRRMLHPMRNEWEMVFMDSGAQALEQLAQRDFHVLVSDMRMPGMDGVELFRQVKEKYPQIARIALSGQTSKESILRSVGPIHQYLPKPCDAETLKATINRVCALRTLLLDPRLLGLISRLETLPCLSQLYTQLMEELSAPEASIKTISGLISRDVAMSAKLMQIVNSAYFGLPREIASVEQAVIMLGLNVVKSLALTLRIFAQFDPGKIKAFSLEQLWAHSTAAGEHAKLIARREKLDERTLELATLTGMLHDVGKLVFATIEPDEYARVLQLREARNCTDIEAEREVFGATHAELGAYLLGLWGFAEPIIEAIAFHHRPSACGRSELGLVTVIHAADLLACEQTPAPGSPAPDEAYLAHFPGKLDAWRSACLAKTN